jgi:hypothetical protein
MFTNQRSKMRTLAFAMVETGMRSYKEEFFTPPRHLSEDEKISHIKRGHHSLSYPPENPPFTYAKGLDVSYIIFLTTLQSLIGHCSQAKYGEKPYSHPSIATIISRMWFKGANSVGAREWDTFKAIPPSMIALAATAVRIFTLRVSMNTNNEIYLAAMRH